MNLDDLRATCDALDEPYRKPALAHVEAAQNHAQAAQSWIDTAEAAKRAAEEARQAARQAAEQRAEQLREGDRAV